MRLVTLYPLYPSVLSAAQPVHPECFREKEFSRLHFYYLATSGIGQHCEACYVESFIPFRPACGAVSPPSLGREGVPELHFYYQATSGIRQHQVTIYINVPLLCYTITSLIDAVEFGRLLPCEGKVAHRRKAE